MYIGYMHIECTFVFYGISLISIWSKICHTMSLRAPANATKPARFSRGPSCMSSQQLEPSRQKKWVLSTYFVTSKMREGHLTDRMETLLFAPSIYWYLLCAWVAGIDFSRLNCFWFLLRSASTLAVRVGDKIGALKGLAMRLREISQYLSQVVAGKLPMNQAASSAGSTRTSMCGWWFCCQEIIYQLQEIFNLMPDQECFWELQVAQH